MDHPASGVIGKSSEVAVEQQRRHKDLEIRQEAQHRSQRNKDDGRGSGSVGAPGKQDEKGRPRAQLQEYPAGQRDLAPIAERLRYAVLKKLGGEPAHAGQPREHRDHGDRELALGTGEPSSGVDHDGILLASLFALKVSLWLSRIRVLVSCRAFGC